MYKEYIEGIEKEVERKALKMIDGDYIINTSLQRLDYDFKRELLNYAIDEGLYCESWTYCKFNQDYRVAKYLARCYERLLYSYSERELSYNTCKVLLRKFCKYANKSKVTLRRYKIKVKEIKSGFRVYVISGDYEYLNIKIGRTQEGMLLGMAKVIGYLASDRYEKEDRAEVRRYFLKVTKKLVYYR